MMAVEECGLRAVCRGRCDTVVARWRLEALMMWTPQTDAPKPYRHEHPSTDQLGAALHPFYLLRSAAEHHGFRL